MSQNDVIFIRRVLVQIRIAVFVVAAIFVFFEVTGLFGKASKKELEDVRSELWLKINDQTVIMGNFIRAEKISCDSLWNELYRMQEEINKLSPYKPEAQRGGLKKILDTNFLIPATPY